VKHLACLWGNGKHSFALFRLPRDELPTAYVHCGLIRPVRMIMQDEYGVNHDIFSLRRVDWASAGSRGAYRATAARTIRSVSDTGCYQRRRYGQ
jgi:hypothetical protein